MKILISSMLLIVFTLFTQPAVVTNYSCSKTNSASSIISVITYERVFHDNVWWIVVYQDGMKINEYPDID